MSEVKFDLKKLIESRLLAMNKNKENIDEKKDILYQITQTYLQVLNANPKFLDKPAIVERVMHIIFNNILLSENVHFKSNGIITKGSDSETQKIFSVLKDGSIIFYREDKSEKLVVAFDELDEGLACRFLEYSKGEYLKSEKRVIIDDYGFDKMFYEIGGITGDKERNEKLRETFKHIITYLNDREIIAFTDWGNHSITPLLDNKFLCDKDSKKICLDELYEENRYQSINLDNSADWLVAFPLDIPEMDEFSISKVQAYYNYYANKYPLAKAWFINRYGKQFLINNNIISQEETIEEEGFFEKLSQATQEEVILNFKQSAKNDFEYEELIGIIENMYFQKMYGKAIAFFDLLTDKQKIEFLNNNENYETNFVSTCICRIENDSKKEEQYVNFFEQLSLNNKIAIISSIEDEDDKVRLYEEILEEIIEYDVGQEEYDDNQEEVDTEYEGNFENDEEKAFSEITYLSKSVLDSLKDKENIKTFILKFSSFPIIKYEHLKDMTKEDIDYLIENLEGNLDQEDNIAFLQTDYLEDDYILELLKDNWEEGLELSSDAPIDLEEDLGYSFKVYALTKVKDEERRLEFLEEYQDDFSPEEILMLLENMEDSEEMLNLAKKYNLSQDYISGLVVLCDDDIKISFLNSQKSIESENFIRVASSIEDIPRAFNFIVETNKVDIIAKLQTINELYIDLADDDDISKLAEKKFQFLMQNSQKILNSIKNKEDAATVNIYISEFWIDEEKMASLGKTFKNIIEEDCK